MMLKESFCLYPWWRKSFREAMGDGCTWIIPKPPTPGQINMPKVEFPLMSARKKHLESKASK